MLGKYIKRILASANSNQASHSEILEVCGQVVTEADDLANIAQRSSSILDINSLQSSNSLRFAKRMNSTVRTKMAIGKVLEYNANTVKNISDGILKIFEQKKDFTLNGMSTQDAITLQLLDMCAYFNEKARMYILLTLHYENTQMKKGFGDSPACPYTMKEVSEFDQDLADFAKVCEFFFKNYQTTADKIIHSIPNENFSFDNAELMNSSRFNKLPQVRGFTGDGFTGFIHSLLSYIAIRQAAKIEKAQIEVDNIEIHLLELQESSPNNEKAIKYHTERLRKANETLRDLKEKYDVK